MKVFLVEVITLKNETAKAITEKESYEAALMALYQSMASAIANKDVKKAAAAIIDDSGIALKNEIWTRTE